MAEFGSHFKVDYSNISKAMLKEAVFSVLTDDEIKKNLERASLKVRVKKRNSEESEPAGGASGMRGFVSQLDPRYKNMKMGE